MHSFCPSQHFTAPLRELIRKSIWNTDAGIIDSLYDRWGEAFDADQFYLHPAGRSEIARYQHCPEQASLRGMDLPVWFSSAPEPKRKIVVIGIDPLRNPNNFKGANADTLNDLLIGTPYALHSGKMRVRRTAQYWNMIRTLAEEQLVYVTDIYKTFFYHGNERSYDYYRNHNLSAHHLDILAQELELISPDLIVTMGWESLNQLVPAHAPFRLSGEVTGFQWYGNIPVLPMVHLSGSVRTKIKKAFLHKNGLVCENSRYYGYLYAELIRQQLSGITGSCN